MAARSGQQEVIGKVTSLQKSAEGIDDSVDIDDGNATGADQAMQQGMALASLEAIAPQDPAHLGKHDIGNEGAARCNGIEKSLFGQRGLNGVIPDQDPHHNVGIKRPHGR